MKRREKSVEMETEGKGQRHGKEEKQRYQKRRPEAQQAQEESTLSMKTETDRK